MMPGQKRKRKYYPHLNVKRNKMKLGKKNDESDDDDLHEVQSEPKPPPPTNQIEIMSKKRNDSNSPTTEKGFVRISREMDQLNSVCQARTKKTNVVSPGHDNESEARGNRIVDISSLITMVKKNTLCKYCGSKVKINEETVGVATTVKLSCTKCTMKRETECVRTKLNSTKNGKKYNTVELYFINTMLVLGIQQIGGGPAECEVLLTYLGLPHGVSFGRKSFSRIEHKLGDIIKKISDKSMADGIDDEVRLTRTVEDYTKWKNDELPAQANGLTVCYDMGWNKRSSGNRYDSVSGHGIIIGAFSKKILCFRPVSKVCMFCKLWTKKMVKVLVFLCIHALGTIWVPANPWKVRPSCGWPRIAGTTKDSISKLS